MKKVLIISYKFPPDPDIGGFRIQGLAKHLPEYDWEPIVVTTELPGPPNAQCRVIQTKYDSVISLWKRRLGFKGKGSVKSQLKVSSKDNKKGLFDKIILNAYELLTFPDAEKGWKPYAINTIKDILETEKIDAILSSSAPVTSHFIAKDIRKKYGIPWIADLRDLWSENHYYKITHGPVWRWIKKRVELSTLRYADAIVTVSPVWADKLAKLHKRDLVYSITNGFDYENIHKESKLTDKFTITYTGKIYTGAQNPSLLFLALKELISEGKLGKKDVEVRFFGSETDWLNNEIKKYDLCEVIKYYGLVSREISYEKQRESQILLLLNWADSHETGWYPLKIFEYLSARRPILAIGGSGTDLIQDLLNETKSGVYATEIKEIKNEVFILYNQYKKDGRVKYYGDENKIKNYTYYEMAGKFSKILNTLVKNENN